MKFADKVQKPDLKQIISQIEKAVSYYDTGYRKSAYPDDDLKDEKVAGVLQTLVLVAMAKHAGFNVSSFAENARSNLYNDLQERGITSGANATKQVTEELIDIVNTKVAAALGKAAEIS